jgi:hypothetical protein
MRATAKPGLLWPCLLRFRGSPTFGISDSMSNSDDRDGIPAAGSNRNLWDEDSSGMAALVVTILRVIPGRIIAVPIGRLLSAPR